jgi:hypothetical protein
LGSNPVGRLGCGNINNVFSPYCQRGTGGTAVQMAKADYRFCSSDMPDYGEVAAGEADSLGYDRNAIETGSCNTTDHFWTAEPAAWDDSAPWSSDCSNTATQTRMLKCTRRFDGSTPANPDSACGTADKPAASRTSARYGSCSYKAVRPGAWGEWASTCSASTTRTRTNACQRINSSGEVITDSVSTAECTNRGIPVVETETGSNYAGCTSSWKEGAWSGFSSSCSPTATRTRSITCSRDLDGAAQPDASCSAATRPASSESQAQYAGCSYSYATGEWSGWSSNCSNTASRTRSVVCQRTDGASLRDSIPDSECTARGIGKPTSSETQGMYGSCSYTPSVTSRSVCTMQSQQTITWGCSRNLDGTQVAPSFCGKPASEVVACTPAYTWAWSAGAWSGYNSGCSATATRTRPVTCQRSDGAPDADRNCNAAARPASSETAAQYGSCGYSAGGSVTQGGWSSTCSANATRTSTSQCVRSDGAVVANAECTNRGVALTTTQTQPVYSGCGYSIEATTPFTACAPNGTQTRNVQCRRTDGTLVDNSLCGNNGIQTQSCTYTPTAGNTCDGGVVIGTFSDWYGNGTSNGDVWAREIGSCNTRGGNCVQADNSLTNNQEQGNDQGNNSIYKCFKNSVGLKYGYCNTNTNGGCAPNATFQNPPGAGGTSYCSGGTVINSIPEIGDSWTDNGQYAANCKAAGGNCLERRYDHTIETSGQQYDTTYHTCYRGATQVPVPAGTGSIQVKGQYLSNGSYGWCSYGGGGGQESANQCLRGTEKLAPMETCEYTRDNLYQYNCSGTVIASGGSSWRRDMNYQQSEEHGDLARARNCYAIGGNCVTTRETGFSEYGNPEGGSYDVYCMKDGDIVQDTTFVSDSFNQLSTNACVIK